jgi:malate/lactate dehydrogenase
MRALCIVATSGVCVIWWESTDSMVPLVRNSSLRTVYTESHVSWSFSPESMRFDDGQQGGGLTIDVAMISALLHV